MDKYSPVYFTFGVMLIKNQSQKYMFGELSLWMLLFSNLVTIFLAVLQNWNLTTLLLIYWFQSMTIGIFNFLRILFLKEFSTKDFKIKHLSVQAIQFVKIFVAVFFLTHYSFFHIVYLFFILAGMFGHKLFGAAPSFMDILFTFLLGILFFINHLFSFIYNRPRDTKRQNIGTLMFYPYARIVPMHLTIIFGGLFGPVLLPFFLILKTISDAIMHVLEHKIIRKGMEQETNG